jgi:phosphate transport system substrate-binding protein
MPNPSATPPITYVLPTPLPTSTSLAEPVGSPRAVAALALTPATNATPQPAPSTNAQGFVEATSLSGSGAGFPRTLFGGWFSAYEKQFKVKVGYDKVASDVRFKALQDGTVDFGATDTAMTDAELKAAKQGEILHIPLAVSSLVVTYNLPGVDDQILFTPDVIAGMYMGQITRWNDPKIVADNPSLAPIAENIVVVYRSDETGTTGIWTDYLSSVSPDWKQQVGRGKTVKWPVGTPGNGNEGLIKVVQDTDYSIGYMELINSIPAKLRAGLVQNRSGRFVAASSYSASAAADVAADSIGSDMRGSIVNQPGDGSYPIVGLDWMLVYKNQRDPAAALALTRLLLWELHEGQTLNSKFGLAPLPKSMTKHVEGQIMAIQVNGHQAYAPRAS